MTSTGKITFYPVIGKAPNTIVVKFFQENVVIYGIKGFTQIKKGFVPNMKVSVSLVLHTKKMFAHSGIALINLSV